MTTRYEAPLGALPVVLEFDTVAMRATQAVMLQQGDTVLLVTLVVAPEAREGVDFLPLTVDFEERLAAAGSISGSRYVKREGKPSEHAVLTSRMTDRPLRPLLASEFRRDIQLVGTVLSYDPTCPPDVLFLLGASACLSRTDQAPFAEPAVTVRVVELGGELVVMPSQDAQDNASFELVATFTKDRVAMLEFSGQQISEARVLEALVKAREAAEPWLTLQQSFFTPYTGGLKQEPDPTREAVRAQILAGNRPDGRGYTAIRPVSLRSAFLPRTHGSGLFTRGETQALSTVTLAGPADQQEVEGMGFQYRKRFMHHYSFPPYSTGEAAPLRSAGRREIGHGALAEKALEPVLPTEDRFPYTIRVTSEILSSNGSSSMAATCGATVALLDAGVPLAAPVAGIALGLVSEGSRWQLLMDLQGEEDRYGDMDFKVAGTRHGITAIQMDTKLPGIPWEVVGESLSWAARGRSEILDLLESHLPAHRQLSAYAPRILTIDISPSQIGELIGPGGKTIQRLIEDCGGKELTSIDVQPTGRVTITSRIAEYAESAYAHIRASMQPIAVGTILTGRVSALVSDKRNPDIKIGAIVDIAPGKSGMIHISEASPGPLKSIDDVFKVGDEVRVRVLSVDTAKGRIALRPEAS